MSGDSEKKIKKSSEQAIKYYQAVLIINNFIFIVVNLFMGYLFEFNTIMIFLFFAAVSLLTYKMITDSLKLGLSSDAYSIQLDIFALNAFIQFTTTCISSKFWYIYLIVPGYIGWLLIKWCWGRATNIEYEEKGEDKDGKSKKKEKKKEKVIYKKIK